MNLANSQSSHEAAHPQWASFYSSVRTERSDQASLGEKTIVWTLLAAASVGVWAGVIWTAQAAIDLLWLG